MPIVAAPEKEDPKDNKLFAKHKWRGKLFSGDSPFGKSVDEQASKDEDVAQFLGHSGRRSEDSRSSQDQAQDSQLPTRTSASSPPAPTNVYHRAKPKQNKGLQVGFVKSPPEIIGLGGDEAETPSSLVSSTVPDTSASSDRRPPVSRKPVPSILEPGSTSNQGAQAGETSSRDFPERRRSFRDSLRDIGDVHPSVLQSQAPSQDEISMSISPLNVGTGLDRTYTGNQSQNPSWIQSPPDVESSRNSPELRFSPEPASFVQRSSSRSADNSLVERQPSPLLGAQYSHETSSLAYRSTSRSPDGRAGSRQPSPLLEPSVPLEETSFAYRPSSRSSDGKSASRRPSPLLEPGVTLEKMSLAYRSSSRSPDGRSANRHPLPLREPSTSPSRVERQLPAPPDHNEAAMKPRSLRNVVQNLGTDALEEFDGRISRFNNIFQLGVAVHQDPMQLPFQQWIKVATWWFLRGRGELETEVRSQPKDADKFHSNLSGVSTGLKQAYVDLAKAWWIVKEITPNHPELRRYGKAGVKSMVPILENFGNQDLAKMAQHHLDIHANIRALAMSMKRNGRLPPDQFELQGLDVRVLLENPPLPADALRAFAFQKQPVSKNTMASVLPLGDSKGSFHFSRIFGSASVASRQKTWDTVTVPTVVSLSRLKTTLDLTASILSQDESIDLVIQTEKDHPDALTWSDVNWSSKGNFISITISRDMDLSVLLSEQDFRTLWSICDYTRKVQKDYQGRKGEEIAYDVKLYDFQCLTSKQHASSFPTEPLRDCKIRLFTKVKTYSDGSGRIHGGFRLMAKTPPEIKSLSSISQDYGEDMPTVFGFGRRDDRARLSIRVPGSSTFVLTFRTWEDLDLFYNVFTQRQASAGETRSSSLSLQRLLITTNDTSNDSITTHLRDTKWQHAKVINQVLSTHHKSISGHHSSAKRLIVQSDEGILTECLPMRTGDLQINLSVDDCNEVRILRTPQRDIFGSLTDHGLATEKIDSWRGMLWAAGRSTAVKSYSFKALKDLHVFEALVLGFDVLYEGVGSYFAISRRRKGVPLHKYWEADFVRMQILKQEKTVQLVLFFKDFSHGSSMNFALKSTDFFEKHDKSDEHQLRIVDAKFALPKGPEDPTRDFVCLDLPDYPSEHDDIVIGFHDMNERDNFSSQLPAAATRASRMGTLRKASRAAD